MVKFHPKPVIYGLQSLSLNDDERTFFKQAQPFAFILFSRNIESAEQLRALIHELAEYSAFDEALVLIDQEGGRVARIQPPMMLKYPAAQKFHQLYNQDKDAGERATYLAARSLAGELRSFGIGVNCAPVCDILTQATHDVIGDRAFGDNPQTVSALAAAQSRGLMDAGVLPVIKHIPGHGRALVDSHESLPIVNSSYAELSSYDFIPFRHLKKSIFAMTAHILYSDLDSENPMTLSQKIITEIIRKDIGFEGLLMSDDLSMGALGGALGGTSGGGFGGWGGLSLKALAAGCDLLLHCNGDMAEMVAIDEVLPLMDTKALDFFKNRYREVIGKAGRVGGVDMNIMRDEWLQFCTEYGDFFNG